MARVDVRATAASGVWRSPQPLPLAHLAVTVNACDSGDVLIFWTQPLNTAPPPAGVAADGSLGIGQSAAFDTGLTNHGTVYVCDVRAGALDVTVIGSDDAVAATPAQPTSAPIFAPLSFMCDTPASGGVYHSQPIPIPPGTLGVFIGFNANAPPQLRVLGSKTAIPYYDGPPANFGLGGLVICGVSSVNDGSVIVSVTIAYGVFSGILVPLLSPYVPQPLSIAAAGPLPLVAVPAYLANVAEVFTLNQSVQLIPAPVAGTVTHLRHLTVECQGDGGGFTFADGGGRIFLEAYNGFAHVVTADLDRWATTTAVKVTNTLGPGTIRATLTYDQS